MKARTLILGLLSSCGVIFASCDRDGNTGNGANDPTAQYESDKTMKTGDSYVGPTDTTAKETTTITTVDTTMVEGRHK